MPKKSSVNISSYTHNLFPFPAKFPPEPIRKFMLKYSQPGSNILDPFSGSGTVLVEALMNDRTAHGIELNPVAALVSRAKATIYGPKDVKALEAILDELASLTENRDEWASKTLNPLNIPQYKNVEHWFQKNMLYELTALRNYFLFESQQSKEVKNLLWMAFLKIIVPVSNQDGETRYAAIKKNELQNGYALHKFSQVLREYRDALSESSAIHHHRGTTKAVVEEGDSRIVLERLPNSSFDLVITSPPYINTFDYYLYHKHRIFWMGKDPQKIRAMEIGCHHLIDRMTYTEALGEYHDYLQGIFDQIYLKLKRNKYFIILIGDGIVKGRIVRGDTLVFEMAEKSGFSVEDVETIGLREVSRGFIKNKRIDKKNHHAIVLKR